MPVRRLALCLAALSLLHATAPRVAAQHGEFALGVGYSHLSLDDAAGTMDSDSGGRFELRYSWRPSGDVPQLRLGVGLGFSGYYDESHQGFVTSGPFSFEVKGFEEVGVFTPELQLSWREPLGDRWMIEGGAGIGPTIASYEAGDIVFDDLVDTDVSESTVGLGLRPFVRGGYRHGRWTFGLEAAYLWTTADFDEPFGDDLSEWHLGVFFAFAR